MADETRRNPASQPITSHPLFPTIVALWVGALSGLASVAIAPTAVESIVVAAGIDRVIPMAAPPLGTTFRILLTLLATGIGCVVGFLVARRIATPRVRASARPNRPAHTAEAASPIALFDTASDIPNDDIDDFSDDEEEALPTVRRRQLVPVIEHDPAGDTALVPETARIQQPPPQILNVTDLDFDMFETREDRGVFASEAFDMVDDGFASDPRIDLDSPDGIFDRPLARPAQAEQQKPAKRGSRLFAAYLRAKRSEPTNDQTIPAPGFTLLPRLDEPSLETGQQSIEQSIAPDNPEAATDSPDDAAKPASPSYAYASAAERIATAPLGDLSHVELLERLALALKRRRATDAAAKTEPSDSEAPDATVPIEDDSDDELPPLVPPRRFALSAIPTPGADDADEDAKDNDDTLAKGYSSLLNLTKPSRGRLLGLRRTSAGEPDPVVAFPGLASATPTDEAIPENLSDAPASEATATPTPPRGDSEDTERALRAALATLQRMSGAA